MNLLTQNALVLILAVGLDRFLPEPPHRFHPVVWMGRLITALEVRTPKAPASALIYGAMVVVVVVGIFGCGAWWAMTTLEAWGEVAHVLGGALLMRTTFATRALSTAANRTRRALAEDRLDDARDSLRNLVSRDPTVLDRSLIAAAAIESVAENTTDSFVGPWLAFAVLGVPAAVAYRAINTLDSMLGYRGAYEYLGKTSARLDDLVNLIPARLSAVLLLASGALAGLPARLGRRTGGSSALGRMVSRS
ncbi:MAG: cobalamin biosynthesis protein CobD [Actinomycetia bacterium]|nr:cobalamin biosynthesis protein CobD [Actinomycetes bacterium]